MGIGPEREPCPNCGLHGLTVHAGIRYCALCGWPNRDEVDAVLEDRKEKVLKSDAWMSHFMDQTWKLQGPDFSQNVWANLMLGRFQKGSMWQSLPGFDSDTILIVGAGPSLVENLEDMRNLPAHWPLLVTDRAYRQVHEAGLRPHAVTNLEATIETLPDVKKWWEGLPRDVPLITVAHADPTIHDLWSPGPVYWMNTFNQENSLLRYAKKIEWLTGSKPMLFGTNVGVTSIILAANLLREDGMNHSRDRRPLDIVLVGFDHAYYKDNLQVNFNVNDIRGRDTWLPWNFFIGQFEVKFIAGVVKEHGIRLWNASEAGIVYGGDVNRISISEFIEEKAKAQEAR